MNPLRQGCAYLRHTQLAHTGHLSRNSELLRVDARHMGEYIKQLYRCGAFVADLTVVRVSVPKGEAQGREVTLGSGEAFKDAAWRLSLRHVREFCAYRDGCVAEAAHFIGTVYAGAQMLGGSGVDGEG
ncbi:hypothetical protein DVU_2393 [Nitratidesulfovibrio vulgaris str. Hildenborough]|uniref:Uncharacterized protein n=1 Tax=Nitratidesulfovibrio vulgaris (strain ATCC 29579 / DSM 644 / CCUG 34227 / NCIMB 8303 / VKM B-1760 / Hildenborough) TaxID=882 RepID=Q729F8_NITV2|nr:hypothetical protein DVU_2393 [Nitratidesulfovibrio vulgaris str. Hildenborough]